jgi:hypothetical protein
MQAAVKEAEEELETAAALNEELETRLAEQEERADEAEGETVELKEMLAMLEQDLAAAREGADETAAAAEKSQREMQADLQVQHHLHPSIRHQLKTRIPLVTNSKQRFHAAFELTSRASVWTWRWNGTAGDAIDGHGGDAAEAGGGGGGGAGGGARRGGRGGEGTRAAATGAGASLSLILHPPLSAEGGGELGTTTERKTTLVNDGPCRLCPRP